ncbi:MULTISPECIES: dihydroneopterin aldolase [unclassified Mucilaginibacter]|uniref:dihydroneopterin aldolase n=1 Tax=unclassified Mucilaginibacter TaxID=2617802 RepID=UPI002AC95A56|nr:MULTISPECIES: dihydroneopterin aldolase [unclassified Mucilaginibacter]MEB0261380.1 dihydroneopterin aldolase [Mucilaginibacter sp. 10I4]MEB0278861.1 dihydroneopterin aldolase [Mucilaginibacter sp. 10B2]MEB0299773.1 dihydroneopterin aldolase [Mucilaginibacter sp. 5C4]WPX22043.1 dihydroneopterin aldolase [Mucilaginibacter sp. 5C4]
MIKVALEGAEFFAYHGFYPEEQVIGTRFLVDVQVGFYADIYVDEDNLHNTVNYEVLYNIIDEEMQHTRKVIETVAQSILNRIKTEFTFIETAEVTIRKQRPPFRGPLKQSVITLFYTK